MGCANDGDFVTSQLLIIVFPHFKSAMPYFFSHLLTFMLLKTSMTSMKHKRRSFKICFLDPTFIVWTKN